MTELEAREELKPGVMFWNRISNNLKYLNMVLEVENKSFMRILCLWSSTGGSAGHVGPMYYHYSEQFHLVN